MTAAGVPPVSVLLVEDHADSRLMYAQCLGPEFHVTEATDGIAAWEILEHLDPDVVVTDLSLPRLDGIELIQRIRADERLRDIGLIALSGYSGGEQEARTRAAGADVLLQKPCLPDDLAKAVVELAARRRNRQ